MAPYSLEPFSEVEVNALKNATIKACEGFDSKQLERNIKFVSKMIQQFEVRRKAYQEVLDGRRTRTGEIDKKSKQFKDSD